MLRTYCSNYAYVRMHQVADFLNVAHIFGAHFHYEHFVVGFQHLVDGAGHAQCGVIAARSHKSIEVLRQYTVQVVFCACFAIAACDTHYFKVGHRLQQSGGTVIKFAVYGLVDRLEQPHCGKHVAVRGAIHSQSCHGGAVKGAVHAASEGEDCSDNCQ